MFRNLLISEDGVTAIEYALLSALIATVIIGGVAIVGDKTLSLWKLVSGCLEKATSGAGICG